MMRPKISPLFEYKFRFCALFDPPADAIVPVAPSARSPFSFAAAAAGETLAIYFKINTTVK